MDGRARRDDHGAGPAQVSAWAGLHCFASRHGFQAPGDGNGDSDAEREPGFTWPEGNAWLAARLAAPHRERIHSGRVVLRVHAQRHGADGLTRAVGFEEAFTLGHLAAA